MGGRSPSCRTLQHLPETRSATYLPGEPSPGGRFPQHTDNSSLPGKRLLSLAPVRAARVARAPPSRKRNLMFNFSPNLPISSSEGAKTGATSASLGPHLTTTKTPAGGRAKHWRAKGRGETGSATGGGGGALAGRIVALPGRPPRRRSSRASGRCRREGDPLGAQSTTGGPRSRLPLLPPRPGPSGRWRKTLHPPPPPATTATVTKWQPGARQSCHRRAGPLPPNNASAPFGLGLRRAWPS